MSELSLISLVDIVGIHHVEFKCLSFQCCRKLLTSLSSPDLERIINECPNCHPSLLHSSHSFSYEELKPCASPTTHLFGISSSKYHLNHVKDNGNGNFFSPANLFAHFGATSSRVKVFCSGSTKPVSI